MHATTDWGWIPASAAPPARPAPGPALAPVLGLALATLALVALATAVPGWPRLAAAVAACSTAMSTLARSALAE